MLLFNKVSISLVGLHLDNTEKHDLCFLIKSSRSKSSLLIHIAKKYIAPCMDRMSCVSFSRHESPLEIAQRMKCADMVAWESVSSWCGKQTFQSMVLVVSDVLWSCQILMMKLRCPRNLTVSGATAINDCHRCSYAANTYEDQDIWCTATSVCLMVYHGLSPWQKALYISYNLSSDEGAMHVLFWTMVQRLELYLPREDSHHTVACVERKRSAFF